MVHLAANDGDNAAAGLVCHCDDARHFRSRSSLGSASGRIRRDAWEIAYPKIRTV